MTDNELLLAISDMMDKKLNHITKDVQEVKKDIKVLKTEVENIDIRVKNIELNQETKVLPRLNTIKTKNLAFSRILSGNVGIVK